MSPLHVMVFAEQLLTAWLRAQPEIAAIVGTRVYTVLPASPTFPLVRVERVAGGPRPGPLHLDAPRVQIEAWGADLASRSKPPTWNLAAVVQAAMHERLVGSHAQGVVTKVETNFGPTWSPDPDTNRDRYILDMTVYTHPNP